MTPPLAHGFTRPRRSPDVWLLLLLAALAAFEPAATGEVATMAPTVNGGAPKGAAAESNNHHHHQQQQHQHRSSNSFTAADAKDGPSKRDTNGVDLSGAASAKSYDPPPEFYRGPGSTSGGAGGGGAASAGGSSSYGDSATAGFISKPVAFPDTTGRNHYGSDGGGGSVASHAYNSWQLLKGSGHPLQDRISVKHYGSPEHGTSGSGGLTGYAYSERPYGGGGGHYADYPPPSHAVHYASTGHGGGGGVGGGGIGGGGGGSYYGSPDGIPFDVYGSKGHYAGAGGEYSYTYPGGGGDIHEPPTHKGHHHELSPKALLAKSFLIPLASAAVLGIAAALISNPLLLQLGTVSGGVAVTPGLVGKRKRRALATTGAAEGDDDDDDHARGLRTSQALAYRGQRPPLGDNNNNNREERNAGDDEGEGETPAVVSS